LYFTSPLKSARDLKNFGGNIPLYGSNLKLQTVPCSEDALYVMQMGNEGKFELGVELKMSIIDWFRALNDSLNAVLQSKMKKESIEFPGTISGVDGNVTLFCDTEGFQFYDGSVVIKDFEWSHLSGLSEEKADHILLPYKIPKTGQIGTVKFFSPRPYEIYQVMKSQLPEIVPKYVPQKQDQESLAKEGKGNRPKKSLFKTNSELKEYFAEKYKEKEILDDIKDKKKGDTEFNSLQSAIEPIEEEQDIDSDEEIFNNINNS